jgi:cytoskeletal protein CcmA (bactofilin family)
MKIDTTNGSEDVRVVGPTNLSSVDCESFNAAGATKVDDSVAARTVSLKGTTTIGGDLKAEEFSAKGTTNVAGEVNADEIVTKGSTRVEGDLRADHLETKGSSKFEDVSAETVSAKGALAVGDLVADAVEVRTVVSADRILADDVHLVLGDSESTVEAVVGGTVAVERGDSNGWIDIGESANSRLNAGTIEGEVVTVEYTTAEEVTGEKVRIGSGSHVGVVRAGKLDVDENATVERTEELD